MQRRDFLRLAAGATGTAIFGSMLGARGAKAAGAAKPKTLNLLYATAEADSEAIKFMLPDFASKLGIKLTLDTFPYAALQQKVFAELASSSPFYDIMAVDTPWMPALTKKIEPLISYLKNPQLNDVGNLTQSFTTPIPSLDSRSTIYLPTGNIHHRRAAQVRA